jgi:hypothetical protein
VIFTKSAKLNPVDGVFGPPKPAKKAPPLGVVIMDEGKAAVREGGVEGGYSCAFMAGLAGDGEVARKSSKSAPSSPVLGLPDPLMAAFASR